MWQAKADTELTMSASLPRSGPIDVNHGELALVYGTAMNHHARRKVLHIPVHILAEKFKMEFLPTA